jgi:23S rRNA (cytidine1920-2'-O)/16S rRNA (cytidine1409-2'-O)-methyltransferase
VGGRKKRLDQLLVEKNYFSSREQARRAIMEGVVFYRGQRIEKPGTFVDPEGEIEVKRDPCPFVSRGGLKLDAALDEFGIDIGGRVVLDAGASTGGFTQCLLRRGAMRVFAVDVGYGQLAWELRRDPRVVVLERTNLRYLTPEKLGTKVDLVTLDLSFISLKKVFPAVRELLRDEGEVVALVKPQFEAGRALVGKGGIVRAPETHCRVLEKVIADARGSGFLMKGVTHSPLLGAEGNLEFFLWLVAGEEKHSEQGLVERELSEMVRTVVLRAHDLLLNKGGGAR